MGFRDILRGQLILHSNGTAGFHFDGNVLVLGGLQQRLRGHIGVGHSSRTRGYSEDFLHLRFAPLGFALASQFMSDRDFGQRFFHFIKGTDLRSRL
ncbi:hypothetical protein D3C73_1505520 [compost metagenome]